MRITITEYMEKRNNALNQYIKGIEGIDENIKLLLGDPKIQEYLLKKEAKQKLERNLEKKEQEFQEQIQSLCNHELITLTSEKQFYGYHDYEIECVLCSKHFRQIEFDLKSYYNAKRFIAYARHQHDSYEGRRWVEYTPIYSSVEDIRNYYYELYLKIEKLQKEDYDDLIPKDFNIEDAVWEHFCTDKLWNQKNKNLMLTKKA